MTAAMLTRSVSVLLAAAALAGCADLPEPPLVSRAVDATSPVSARVLEADAAARAQPYPDIAAIPSVPTDLRTEAEWRAAGGEIVGAGDQLQAWKAANPPELTDTEAWAAGQRASVGIDPSTLPPAPTPEESAAYARAQRERATPRD
jgi:hypothetical protein